MVTYPIGDDVQMPGLRVLRTPRVPGIRRVRIGPSFAKAPLDALVHRRHLEPVLRHSLRPIRGPAFDSRRNHHQLRLEDRPPWGNWLSCEETDLMTGDFGEDEDDQPSPFPLEKDHRFVFEVPVLSVPSRAPGRTHAAQLRNRP
jgi:hypothetical protein